MEDKFKFTNIVITTVKDIKEPLKAPQGRSNQRDAHPNTLTTPNYLSPKPWVEEFLAITVLRKGPIGSKGGQLNRGSFN